MRVFGETKPLIGVVHLPPLPGAPRHRGTMRALIERALRDARAYLDQGMDGLIIENYGDAPFHRDRVSPETIAAMAVVARDVRALGRFPLGIQVLRNDAGAALGIAVAIGADFVRVNVLAGAMVTDQGVIEGCAADLLRRRAALRARVAIWADLLVKHAAPLAPVDPAAAARDLRERALADALIVTGPRTGAAVDLEALRQLRRAAPGGPWIAGSGIRADTLADIWDLADGFIVGSSLEERGRAGSPVVPARVQDLVHARRRLLPARS